MSVAGNDQRAAAGPEEPTEGVRAVVTVALVAWLVALGLAVATNTSSGSSALLRTVKSRLVSPVLQPAWLDVGFDHAFTYGLPEDADHEIVVARHGAAPDEAVVLPGGLVGERAARWRRLGLAIALGDATDDGGVVAAGVGRGAFAEAGTDDVTVRVLRESPTSRGAAAPADVEEVSTVRVRRVGGEVHLIRKAAPGELAPLVRPRETAVPVTP